MTSSDARFRILSGNQVGIVRRFFILPATTSWWSRLGREYLIPAVESICMQISIEEKQILIDPPEGLMDLDK